MKKIQYLNIAHEISSGLLSSVVDLTLFSIFLTLSSIGKSPTHPEINRAFKEAQNMLTEINSKTLLQSLAYLKRKNLINYKRRQLVSSLSITEPGKKIIQKLIPKYDQTRHWEGRIYLITYDIPEKHKQHRAYLREYLKKLGAALLQESVWIIFKNPKAEISTFIQDKKISGAVIVSDVGKDGTVGDETLSTLIKRVYHLDELNKRYLNFINENSNSRNPMYLSKFLSILKDDPQLPFELLPADWAGGKAYQIYYHHGGKLLV